MKPNRYVIDPEKLIFRMEVMELTADDVCRELDITKRGFECWTTGLRSPSVAHMRQLEEVLNCCEEDLVMEA